MYKASLAFCHPAFALRCRASVMCACYVQACCSRVKGKQIPDVTSYAPPLIEPRMPLILSTMLLKMAGGGGPLTFFTHGGGPLPHGARPGGPLPQGLPAGESEEP